jgi:hypothetical protein
MRDELRKSAGRVASEQGALWSTQHLDAIDVEELESEPCHLTDIGIVDIHGRRGLLMIGEVVLGHAADGKAER